MANGTASMAKTALATALADGASGAVASTTISDGKYLINCATKDETEFSWGDLLQTTIVSVVAGMTINSIFGALKGCSNARAFNKNLRINPTELPENQKSKVSGAGDNRKNSKNFLKKNCQSYVKRKIKSEFQRKLKHAFTKNTKTVVLKSAKKPGVIFIKGNSNSSKMKNEI